MLEGSSDLPGSLASRAETHTRRLRDRTRHALIGPNGAGKTTAFNLLSGMYRPDEGTITLDGAPIAGLPPERITAAGVGRSFQITNLFSSLSVRENARLAVQARNRRRHLPVDDFVGRVERRIDPSAPRCSAA